MQRTLTWLVCVICACDFFSHFIFYARDPKCLQRRHLHISKWRLTFRFLRHPRTAATLALRFFPVLLSVWLGAGLSPWLSCGHPIIGVSAPSRLSEGPCLATEPLQPWPYVCTLPSSQHNTPQLRQLPCPSVGVSTVCPFHWAVSSGRGSVVREGIFPNH